MTETGMNVFGMLDYNELDNISDDLLRLYKREKYRYKFTYMNIFEFQIMMKESYRKSHPSLFISDTDIRFFNP